MSGRHNVSAPQAADDEDCHPLSSPTRRRHGSASPRCQRVNVITHGVVGRTFLATLISELLCHLDSLTLFSKTVHLTAYCAIVPMSANTEHLQI